LPGVALKKTAMSDIAGNALSENPNFEDQNLNYSHVSKKRGSVSLPLD